MSIVTVVETPEFQRRAQPDGRGLYRRRRAQVQVRPRRWRQKRRLPGDPFLQLDDGTPIFLITVFAKNEKANLTPSEAEAVRELGQLLATSYRRTT